jgi:hypothetical protein
MVCPASVGGGSHNWAVNCAFFQLLSYEKRAEFSLLWKLSLILHASGSRHSSVANSGPASEFPPIPRATAPSPKPLNNGHISY